MARFITADEAAALIPDDAVVTVSSSSGLGCPDRVLRAIGERFESAGSPRGLTTLHPIAAGDMYGIKGIDHLAKPGLLARVIAGPFLPARHPCRCRPFGASSWMTRFRHTTCRAGFFST